MSSKTCNEIVYPLRNFNVISHHICILQVIELVFTHFDVEPHWGCHYDNLTVFDGASTSSPSLGTYCGNDLPDPVTTSGNTATILFITDDVARYPGFSIDFTARDPSWTTTTIVETTTAPPGGKNGSLKLISPWTKWPPYWQTIFPNEFSWMKMVEFRFKFHWNLFPWVQMAISQHWFR